MSRRSRRLINQINVVPYIDVMLVLLIIFMITTPLLPSGEINLPQVGKANQVAKMPLEVQIKQSGQLLVRDISKGGKLNEVDRIQLISLIQAKQLVQPEQAVVIAADKSVKYEEVLKIMDLLQKNAVKHVGLLVTPSS